MSMLDSAKSFFTGVNKAMLIVTNDANCSLGTLSTNDVQTATQLALQQSADISSAISSSDTAGALNSSGYKILVVQYNPSSLTFQGSAKDINTPTLNRNKLYQPRVQSHNSPTVILAVDLVFDDMKDYECFVSDTLDAGLTPQSAVTAIGAISDYRNKITHSVRDITNGLMYASIAKETRNVIFKWADLSFRGDLTQAEGRYTMFSTSGEPVRSEVKLQITKTTPLEVEQSLWEEEVSQLFSQTQKNNGMTTSWGNVLNWG